MAELLGSVSLLLLLLRQADATLAPPHRRSINAHSEHAGEKNSARVCARARQAGEGLRAGMGSNYFP